MNTAKQLIALCAGLLSAVYAPVLLAQSTTGTESAQLYQVELLVFRNIDQSRTTAEISRMPKPELADILNQDLARAERRAINTDQPLVAAPSWRPVQPGGYQLNDLANRITRLDAYDLVLHLAWQQTAPDISDAIKLDLAELGVDPRTVAGSVNLFQQRYLHLALDVELQNGSANAPGTRGFNNVLQSFGAPRAMPAIADSRRIRLEELHYFDQPQFGIIARVVRAEPAPAP